MKKIFTIAILLSLGSSVNAQTIPSWKITDVVKYYSQKSDSVYVINFWASFCKPCLEELPYLQSITKKYADKKVKLLLVSLDLASFYPTKIQAFVKKQNINADIGHYGFVVDQVLIHDIDVPEDIDKAIEKKALSEQQIKQQEVDILTQKKSTDAPVVCLFPSPFFVFLKQIPFLSFAFQ